MHGAAVDAHRRLLQRAFVREAAVASNLRPAHPPIAARARRAQVALGCEPRPRASAVDDGLLRLTEPVASFAQRFAVEAVLFDLDAAGIVDERQRLRAAVSGHQRRWYDVLRRQVLEDLYRRERTQVQIFGVELRRRRVGEALAREDETGLELVP